MLFKNNNSLVVVLENLDLERDGKMASIYMVNSFWYISWDKISLLWSCWCRWINSIKGVISCTIFRILFLSFGLAFAKAKICNHFGMQFYILDCYSKNKTKNTLEMQETTASIKSFLCNI